MGLIQVMEEFSGQIGMEGLLEEILKSTSKSINVGK